MRDRLGLSAAILALSRRPFSVSSSALASVKKRMPPKKAQAQEKKVLLGRPSNNLKIGIVGAYLLFSLMSISNLPQDFQMSANHLSSMSSPRQVNYLNITQWLRVLIQFFSPHRPRKGSKFSLRYH
jgi:hypothetical protein